MICLSDEAAQAMIIVCVGKARDRRSECSVTKTAAGDSDDRRRYHDAPEGEGKDFPRRCP